MKDQVTADLIIQTKTLSLEDISSLVGVMYDQGMRIGPPGSFAK